MIHAVDPIHWNVFLSKQVSISEDISNKLHNYWKTMFTSQVLHNLSRFIYMMYISSCNIGISVLICIEWLMLSLENGFRIDEIVLEIHKQELI